MKIITKTITFENQSNGENKKHLVYFFGLGDYIRNDKCEEQRWKDWKGQNIDIHMFNYHYSENDYPEHFHNIKSKLKRALITTIVASALGFIGYSIIASKMPISAKVPIFILFLIPVIITAAIVIFYPYTVPLFKFATRGKDPVKAGVAEVIDLLEKGIHPNDIILMGNSLGGGIAAEILKKFEEENIHFTLIHSNSYSSAQKIIVHLHGNFIAMLARWFGFDYEPNEIIKSTKSPVLVMNKIDDQVISKKIQSVSGLKSQEKSNSNDLKILVTLKHKEHDDYRYIDIHNIDEFEMDISNIDYLGSSMLSSNEQGPYKELLWDFIGEAHKHLEEKKLNEGFNPNNFKQSKFYQKMKKDKILLIDIDNPSSKIINISYNKQKEDGLGRTKMYHG